jgi:hypothetical protein
MFESQDCCLRLGDTGVIRLARMSGSDTVFVENSSTRVAPKCASPPSRRLSFSGVTIIGVDDLWLSLFYIFAVIANALCAAATACTIKLIKMHARPSRPIYLGLPTLHLELGWW